MFTGHKKKIPKALGMEIFCLGNHLINSKRSPKDCSISGKSTIGAVVHTLVGDVERRKQPHRFPKILPRGHLAFPRKHLQRDLVIQ